MRQFGLFVLLAGLIGACQNTESAADGGAVTDAASDASEAADAGWAPRTEPCVLSQDLPKDPDIGVEDLLTGLCSLYSIKTSIRFAWNPEQHPEKRFAQPCVDLMRRYLECPCWCDRHNINSQLWPWDSNRRATDFICDALQKEYSMGVRPQEIDSEEKEIAWHGEICQSFLDSWKGCFDARLYACPGELGDGRIEIAGHFYEIEVDGGLVYPGKKRKF